MQVKRGRKPLKQICGTYMSSSKDNQDDDITIIHEDLSNKSPQV